MRLKRKFNKRNLMRLTLWVLLRFVSLYEAWFPYDRRSQKILRSSVIIWKHTSAIVCDPVIVIADDWKFCDRLRSFVINCDQLRSCGHMETGKVLRFAIERV